MVLLYRKVVVTLQSTKSIGDKIMARPIAETPILTGEDAIRFELLRKEVDSLTKEQRAENTRKMKEAIKNAKNRISILKIRFEVCFSSIFVYIRSDIRL